MNITRNNYEEFFLLYVDNELSAAERNAVELFVEQNPDLGKELQMLQQTVMNSEVVEFDDKETLKRTENVQLLQEKLMMYADDELSESERAEVEELIHSNDAAANEWNVLQRSILQPEQIIFPDKASLYRKEKPKVVAFVWWRVAAAVLLLLMGIWLGKTIFNSDSNAVTPDINSVAKGNKATPVNKVFSVDTAIPQQPATNNNHPENIANAEKQHGQNASVEERHNVAEAKTNREVKNPSPIRNNSQKENIATAQTLQNPQNPTPGVKDPVLENINNGNSNNAVAVNVTPKTPENIIKTPVESIKTDNNNNAQANSLARTAVYRENENEGSDTKILYVDEDKLKKTRIGGLFRKIRRIVERTANLKTGNSVKVAGFAIALKN